jgi:hypothetical protein
VAVGDANPEGEAAADAEALGVSDAPPPRSAPSDAVDTLELLANALPVVEAHALGVAVTHVVGLQEPLPTTEKEALPLKLAVPQPLRVTLTDTLGVPHEVPEGVWLPLSVPVPCEADTEAEAHREGDAELE